mmetsp:Transcript_14504/g.46901  ORF Transcript_14504/g.46901 Transcript_14504/m.46901 type:complete len:138 (-) Transcript_14504:1510-1923(-)
MSSASACEHLIRMSKHELELFQSQFAKLRRTSRFSSSTPWDRGTQCMPCVTCGYARIRRGDAALFCLHCGFVGCWNPFSSGEKHRAKHAQLHLMLVGTHWLAADVDRLELYCYLCGDFVSDSRIEERSIAFPGLPVH